MEMENWKCGNEGRQRDPEANSKISQREMRLEGRNRREICGA
jgi:hypothetical protein